MHHVRHVGAHHAFVCPFIGEIDRLTVEGEFSATQNDQLQACRTDNNIGVEMFTRHQLNTRGSDLFNVVRHHRGLAGLDGTKQIVIGHEAETLVPWVIAGRKVLIDIDQLANFLAHFL